MAVACVGSVVYLLHTYPNHIHTMDHSSNVCLALLDLQICQSELSEFTWKVVVSESVSPPANVYSDFI